MHTGGLDCVMLGTRATPTYCIGGVGSGCTDGHGIGAVAGFVGAWSSSCGDDVDCSMIRL